MRSMKHASKITLRKLRRSSVRYRYICANAASGRYWPFRLIRCRPPSAFTPARRISAASYPLASTPPTATGTTEFDATGDVVVGCRTEAPTRGVIRPLHPSHRPIPGVSDDSRAHVPIERSVSTRSGHSALHVRRGRQREKRTSGRRLSEPHETAILPSDRWPGAGFSERLMTGRLVASSIRQLRVANHRQSRYPALFADGGLFVMTCTSKRVMPLVWTL
jgi:hypothetical protein